MFNRKYNLKIKHLSLHRQTTLACLTYGNNPFANISITHFFTNISINYDKRERWGKRMQTDGKTTVTVLVKGLVLSAVITFVAVMVLALLILKTDISEKALQIAVVAVYVVACFIAGFHNGRKLKHRRFMWGILGGLLYFVILLILTMAQGGVQFHAGLLTTALICLGSGMFGGMLG